MHNVNSSVSEQSTEHKSYTRLHPYINSFLVVDPGTLFSNCDFLCGDGESCSNTCNNSTRLSHIIQMICDTMCDMESDMFYFETYHVYSTLLNKFFSLAPPYQSNQKV